MNDDDGRHRDLIFHGLADRTISDFAIIRARPTEGRERGIPFVSMTFPFSDIAMEPLVSKCDGSSRIEEEGERERGKEGRREEDTRGPESQRGTKPT